MELALIKLLETRENYNSFRNLFDLKIFSEEVQTLVKDVDDYYKSEVEFIDWENFSSWFKIVQHPKLSEDKAKIYDLLIKKIPEIEVDKNVLINLINKEYATKIFDVSSRVAEGDKERSLHEVENYLSSWQTKVEELEHGDSKLVEFDIDDLLNSVVGSGGLTWRLDCLNQALGPIRPGDFITFAKRPDSGGTSWLCSEATHMAKQMHDQQVLYFNNEESGKKIQWRLLQAALGWTTAQIKENPREAKEKYDLLYELHSSKILVFTNIHNIWEMESRLQRHNPGLIIIDQLWNMKGYEKVTNGETDRQGMLFRRTRELAGEHAPVINVHQLGGQAENKQFPDMSDLYYSQTSIQAHCDALITMGRLDKPGYEYARFLNICKNKLASPEDERLRNGKFEVEILPEIARFKDV